jgi:hypothetical protein
MKRGIVAYSMSAILPFLVFSMAIPALALPTSDDFGVNEARGNTGTVMSIPVNITNAQNGPIISVLFDISYNASIIAVSGVQQGDQTSTWDPPSFNNFVWGTRILIVYDGVTEHGIQNESTGSVVLINFNVVGALGSSSDMNLSNIQLSDTEYQVSTAPAKDGVFRVDA